MPVENIHANGTLMFNRPGEGALSESQYSYFGEILPDDAFTDEDLALIKGKKGKIKGQFRYLSDAQAKTRKKDLDERAELEAELSGDDDNEKVDVGGEVEGDVEPPTPDVAPKTPASAKKG